MTTETTANTSGGPSPADREDTADVVVVGCGAAGLAAAAELARRGRRVIGLEQFELGHDRGSSHGAERIVRAAYTDEVHVSMALASLDGWQRLESAAGVTLLDRVGGVDTGPEPELAALRSACEAAGVAVELMTAAEASRRFPGLHLDHDAMYHGLAATVRADAALDALRRLAVGAGAEFVTRTEVHRIEPLDDDRVRVHHDAGVVTAATCVVTTGAWGGNARWSALWDGAEIPSVHVTQEQVAFFTPRSSQTPWPTFIFREQPPVYGLPTPDGMVKIGEHGTGPVVDPADRSGDVDPTTADRLQRWAARHLPGVDPTPVRWTTCLYASLPDEMFLLDRVGSMVVGIGLGGHGFKFVPEIGRRLADLADRQDPADNPFAFDRVPLDIGASGHR